MTRALEKPQALAAPYGVAPAKRFVLKDKTFERVEKKPNVERCLDSASGIAAHDGKAYRYAAHVFAASDPREPRYVRITFWEFTGEFWYQEVR